LATAVLRCTSPVVVGLDPRWENLPQVFRSGNAEPDLHDKAEACFTFCREIIDVVAPLVPAVKPQLAFYEQLGPAGLVTLLNIIEYARRAGLIVLLDGKRNDIGPTATAYADAYLGASSPWHGDALTVNPYLGSDSLAPFVDRAVKNHAGVFILVKTSNPSGTQFQDLCANDLPLYRSVANYVEELACQSIGEYGYGAVGAVVGATYPQQLAELRAQMLHCWILIPGYGTQGASADDVAGAFDERGLGAIVNSSRGIIFAYERREYRDRFAANQWQQAVEQATLDMIAELRDATTAGKLNATR
jgi:orotidine 5''-phosphate decarboxylase, subfamily 2